MARQFAQNIFESDAATKAQLKEIYDGVVKNLQATLISFRTKNNDLNFSSAGSLEAKRFTNIDSSVYGTARTAGKGKAVKVDPILIPIDKHREIIEELTKADMDAYGVGGIMERRAKTHKLSMGREFERAYFQAIADSGTAITSTATDVQDILEEAIVTLAKTKNDFVDGIERDMMFIACDPTFYSKVKKYVNEVVTNANVQQSDRKIYQFNGVEIDETNYLPDGVLFELYVSGVTVAQPVQLEDEYVGEKIPLSNDFAVELFYDYGTTCVTPDLAFYYEA